MGQGYLLKEVAQIGEWMRSVKTPQFRHFVVSCNKPCRVNYRTRWVLLEPKSSPPKTIFGLLLGLA